MLPVCIIIQKIYRRELIFLEFSPVVYSFQLFSDLFIRILVADYPYIRILGVFFRRYRNRIRFG